MSNLSLISIMRDDPDFGRRLQKKTQEIKEDKEHILAAADEYSQRYTQEIVEGTELRAKLLTEGSAKGLSEKEIMASYGKFVPTVYTPILNMLYFMLRESEAQDTAKYRRRDAINEALIKAKQLNHDDNEPELSDEEMTSILDAKLKELHQQTEADERRKTVNSKFQKEQDTRSKEEDVALKEPEDMESFLFGHLTLDQFNTLKKLKSLTHSNNIEEASLAFKKGKELAQKYKVDWDKIPSYYKK